MGIGKNVKALAKDRGLNLVELSEKSGVPVNTIYTLTQVDPKNATSRTIDKLAKALEVNIETLRTGKEYVSESDKRLKKNQGVRKRKQSNKINSGYNKDAKYTRGHRLGAHRRPGDRSRAIRQRNKGEKVRWQYQRQEKEQIKSGAIKHTRSRPSDFT